jgi:tripartite-type tricarboxylate transporter receptor subunit TctC
MELIKLETRTDLVHVPYKGSGGALTDLMGGHVQAMIAAVQTVAPFVQSGRLRMLALTGAERSSAFPAVPTLKEQGLANLEVETWYGVLAPAATPPAAITKFNTELNALLQLPDIREQLAKQGMNAAGGTPERFGNLVKSELARWARVVNAAKIKAD